MGALDDNLAEGERVVERARPHWIVALRVGVWTIVWLAIPGAIFAFHGSLTEWVTGVLQGWGIGMSHERVAVVLGVGAIVIVALNLWGLANYLLWRGSVEYAVTTRRVVMREGLIWPEVFEAQPGEIASAQVAQGSLGRRLGYGALTLTATGGAKGRWSLIADPHRFQRAIEAMRQAEPEGGA
jgi:hypothetical protein